MGAPSMRHGRTFTGASSAAKIHIALACCATDCSAWQQHRPQTLQAKPRQAKPRQDKPSQDKPRQAKPSLAKPSSHQATALNSSTARRPDRSTAQQLTPSTPWSARWVASRRLPPAWPHWRRPAKCLGSGAHSAGWWPPVNGPRYAAPRTACGPN